MKKLCLVLLLLFVSSSAFAEPAKTEEPLSPQKVGGFTAILLLLDKGALKEFEKPSSEGLHLTKKSTVKRGETFIVKIGFNGMALDKESKANVTFDFKVVGPDGKLMGKEAHDLPGLQAKVENTSMVFDTQSEIEVGFDKTDKLGIYKVVAVLKDNIGKKTIPMEETIELVE